LLNLIPAIVLPFTVGVSSKEAETCSKDFYYLGVLLWAYFVFFAARDALTLIVVIWFQECEWITVAVQIGWSFIDLFLVTALTIKTTIVISSQEIIQCRASTPELGQWYNAMLTLVIIFWIYAAALYFIWFVLSLLMCCFCVVLCVSG